MPKVEFRLPPVCPRSRCRGPGKCRHNFDAHAKFGAKSFRRSQLPTNSALFLLAQCAKSSCNQRLLVFIWPAEIAPGPARVAMWLKWDSWAFRGESAVANRWLQRERRRLKNHPPSAECAWLKVREGFLWKARRVRCLKRGRRPPLRPFSRARRAVGGSNTRRASSVVDAVRDSMNSEVVVPWGLPSKIQTCRLRRPAQPAQGEDAWIQARSLFARKRAEDHRGFGQHLWWSSCLGGRVQTYFSSGARIA